MFEYTCPNPQCQQAFTVATIESGAINSCVKCGQRLRVVVAESTGPGLSLLAGGGQLVAPGRSRWAGPLLVGSCGLTGVLIAAALLFWTSSGSKSSDAPAGKTVAHNDSPASAREPADTPRSGPKDTAGEKRDSPKEKSETPVRPAPPKDGEDSPRKPEPKETPPSPVLETVPLDDLPKLLVDLAAADPKVRERAARRLGGFGPRTRQAVPDLLKALRKPDEVGEVRAAILAALRAIGPAKEQVTVLSAALGDAGAPAARVYAADALGQLGAEAESVVPALIEALADPETDVRRAAAMALSKIGRVTVRGQVMAALLRSLKDKEREVRIASANGLLGMGAPAPADAPTLKALLADRSHSPEGRVYAASALGELGAEHIPILADAAGNDPDAGVVQKAVEALGSLKAKTKEAGQALTKAVTHPQPAVRIAAAAALGQIGIDAVTIAGILQAIGSKDPGCRKAVLKTLPLPGSFVKDSSRLVLPKEALDDFTSALANEDPIARAVAVYLLGTMGEEAAPAVPKLRKALALEKNAGVQLEMLCAFAEIGPAAKEAVPELTEIMNDTSKGKEPLQRCAALALVKVAEKEAGKPAYMVLAKAMELKTVPVGGPAGAATKPPQPSGGFGGFGALGGIPQRGVRPGMAPPGGGGKSDPIDEEIHERAKKALVKGKAAAASALARTYQDSFLGTDQDKMLARKTTLEVLAKIGRPAKCKEVLQLLTLLNSTRDYPEVMQAAKEAMTAIYRTK